MRAIESFEKLRTKDFLYLGGIGMIWIVIVILVSEHLLISLFISSTILVFTSLLIRKLGAEILLCLCVGFITQFSSAFNGLESNVLALLLAIGLVYESIIFFLYKLFRFTYASVIAASAISISIVGWVLLLLVINSGSTLFRNAINLSLNGFFIGILGSLTGIAIWRLIKNKKWVLEFEYE